MGTPAGPGSIPPIGRRSLERNQLVDDQISHRDRFQQVLRSGRIGLPGRLDRLSPRDQIGPVRGAGADDSPGAAWWRNHLSASVCRRQGRSKAYNS